MVFPPSHCHYLYLYLYLYLYPYLYLYLYPSQRPNSLQIVPEGGC